MAMTQQRRYVRAGGPRRPADRKSPVCGSESRANDPANLLQVAVGVSCDY
jgi:hypothetical protein